MKAVVLSMILIMFSLSMKAEQLIACSDNIFHTRAIESDEAYEVRMSIDKNSEGNVEAIRLQDNFVDIYIPYVTSIKDDSGYRLHGFPFPRIPVFYEIPSKLTIRVSSNPIFEIVIRKDEFGDEKTTIQITDYGGHFGTRARDCELDEDLMSSILGKENTERIISENPEDQVSYQRSL